jgi:RNA polymerase sigma factor (sigma-70 family)
MPSSRYGTSSRHIHTLFSVGAVGGLTDRELLDMFALRRGEASELAFAAMVQRHGPMVYRVCRQVLENPHDADDAFQATFLILLRKAPSLTVSDSLGPWLHGVALRVASCARSARARRQTHERRAGEERKQYSADNRWDDLAIVLHEEIHRLPARFRTPAVLCWLEGFTTEAASRRLRCPQGTILSRLSRARERLRQRLARRGVTLAGGPLGAAFLMESGSATAADAVIESTIQTASDVLSQNGAALVSTEVATLARKVLIAMLLTKVKMTTAVLVSIGTLMAGAGVLARQETAPTRKVQVRPDGPSSAPTTDPDNPPATSDRLASDFDAAAEQFLRQMPGTVAVLGRESNRDNGKLAAHFRDQLNQVESAIRKAREHLARVSGPDSARSSPAVKLPRRPSVLREQSDDSESDEQPGADAHQPTLRAGNYVFTASPTGNKAIAYDPDTREVKAIELNATKEHPLKISPITANAVRIVALRLQGSKITRVAVFDLGSGRWLPMDLVEPASGDVQPAYVGHGGTAYDLGRHLYTFNSKSGTWDHLDIETISDHVENQPAKAPSTGKASK